MLSTPAHSETHDFDIPAGPADEAVQKFVIQANLSVIFDAKRLGNFKTRAIKGNYEPMSALRMLLSGSGIHFEMINSKFISVEPIKVGPVQKEAARDKLQTVRIVAPAVNASVSLPPGVTNTHITHAELSLQGLTTTPDWVRTLTQNQGTGANEATSYQREALTNIAYGSGLNLYGIGQRATLILVNGRRLAPSGSAGSFTDVMNIPLSAVDHIDLISDGAATLYGADAIGGIVNFVLRDSQSSPMTTASFGHLTRGDLAGNEFSQSYAAAFHGWRGVAAVEYYSPSGLPAWDRSQATSNMTPWGGSNFDIPFGNPPSIIDSRGQYWGIATGQDGKLITPESLLTQPNLYDRHAGTWILPQQDRITVLVDASSDQFDNTTYFLEGLFSRRQTKTYIAPLSIVLSVPSTNPFYVNPIAGSTEPVEVLYGFGKDFGPITERGTVDSGQFALGFKNQLNDRWALTMTDGFTFDNQRDSQDNLVNIDQLTYYLEVSDPAIAFNPFSGASKSPRATLAAIRASGKLKYQSAFATTDAELAGSMPLSRIGTLGIKIGYQRRYQVFWSKVSREFNFAGDAYDTDLQRTLDALYLLTSVSVHDLDLGGGLRYEHFNDVGSAFMPAFGFTFHPGEKFIFTGTWTSMFRPPNLPDLNQSVNYAALYPLVDPTSPTGNTPALILGGNNAQLKPETAHSWMLGLKYSPKPTIRLDVQYFNIRSSHQVVQTPYLPVNVLSDPQYSYLFTRDFTQADLANICSRVKLYGTADQCRSPDIGAIVDLRLRSAQTVKTDGFDLGSLIVFDRGYGKLKLDLQATYILHYAVGQPPDGQLINRRNTPHNPIALKLRGVFGWETPHFVVSPAVNFQGGYKDTTSSPNVPVDSWTTWDLVMGYKIGTEGKMRVLARVFNLFNKQPPFLNNDVGTVAYDPENGDLLGRRVSLNLEYEW